MRQIVFEISRFCYPIVAFGFVLLTGCLGGQGSTDGGSGANGNFEDGVFVSGDGTTGRVDIELAHSSIPVGDTSSFNVQVTNSQREPVENIDVACDSEEGLAILEPTQEYELTNSQGIMNGTIGCAAPGTFQLVCRAAVGANRRRFVSVQCTGDTPSGFIGFPNAAGGGLGGGVDTGSNGEVRITLATFVDDGSESSSSVSTGTKIDITQNRDCDGSSSTIDPEPFNDTYAHLRVSNKLGQNVHFSYLQYSVTNVDGQNTPFTSKRLGLSSSSSTGPDSSTIISMPIFKASGGNKYVGDPSGMGIQITNSAILTVHFTLVGETSSGDPVEIQARATASFGDFNRCPSS